MAVRTARLAAGLSGTAGAEKILYTCPADVTAICKDIRLSKKVGGAQSTSFGVRSGPEQTWFINRASPDTELTIELQGFIVLEPGDRLVMSTSITGGYGYHISGAELAGVAP